MDRRLNGLGGRKEAGGGSTPTAQRMRIATASVAEWDDFAESNAAADRIIVENDENALYDELAALSPAQYGKRRQAAAELLGIGVTSLDEEIKLRRKRIKDASSDDSVPIAAWQVEPYDEAVTAGELLETLTQTLRRHVVLPPHADLTIALWVLHAWTHDAFPISPLLAIVSPEKRCGKSTVLNLLNAISPRALPSSNITTAALFRSIEKWRPTLLIDEADTFLGENDELRGVLNSGHCKASAFTLRCTGEDHEPKPYRTWSPKVIAMIGNLPETLLDRSIVIRMRRRKADEEVLRLPRNDVFFVLRRKFSRWAQDSIEALRHAKSDAPAELNDRAADNWLPLFAIADLAGVEWGKRARLVAQVAAGGEDDANSIRVELLNDIRTAFIQSGQDTLFTDTLIGMLKADPERPWAEFNKGKGISPKSLGRLLSDFGITSETIWKGPKSLRGYARPRFDDAFDRYLRSLGPSKASKRQSTCGTGVYDDFRNVSPDESDVSQNCDNPNGQAGFDALTFRNPPAVKRVVPEDRRPALGPPGDSLDDFQ